MFYFRNCLNQLKVRRGTIAIDGLRLKRQKRVFKNALVDRFILEIFLNQLKLRRWNMYCHKTEWIPVNAKIPMCSQCKRIRTTQLTLDGLRLKRQKKFVDKNEEARLI